MIPDKILYTDGHHVTVTDTQFKVRNTSYSLKGIFKHGLLILKPHRLPSILLLLIGLVVLMCGLLKLISPATIPDIKINEAYVTANAMAVWIGGSLALIGIIVAALIQERYAVRIATAEGEKNAVVSRHKEYIAQIVSALNIALPFEKPASEKSLM